MPAKSLIKEYDVPAFTTRFMPEPVALQKMLKPGFGKFFIVKVQEMYRLVKGAVPPSRATGHSCIFITGGKARMKVGSGNYTIHKNEMLFVPAGQVFSFAPGDVNKGYLCNFHADIFIGLGNAATLRHFEFLHVWGNPHLCPDTTSARFIAHLFKRMLLEYTRNGLHSPGIIQAYLLAMLYESGQAYTPLFNGRRDAAITLTNRFKELIVNSIHTQHQVAQYAERLSITPNHLAKTVKAITGKSPTRWIDEAIVLEAKVLLSQSDMPISSVANDVGFEDQSYFTRLFKRYEGITPTAFRKKMQKS